MKQLIFNIYYNLRFRLFSCLALKSKLRIKENDNIIILSPHPDDETFGCGELIAEAIRAKCNIKVVIVSDGSKSHVGCCDIQTKNLIAARRRCCIRALEQLGVNSDHIIFGKFEDGTLNAKVNEIVAWLIPILEKVHYRLFVPGDSENWPDHIAVQRVGNTLAKELHLQCFFYHVWKYIFGLSLKDAFSASRKSYFYINSKVAHEKKLQAIRIYQDSIAKCGRPYAGVLPGTLWKVIKQKNEFYYKNKK